MSRIISIVILRGDDSACLILMANRLRIAVAEVAEIRQGNGCRAYSGDFVPLQTGQRTVRSITEHDLQIRPAARVDLRERRDAVQVTDNCRLMNSLNAVQFKRQIIADTCGCKVMICQRVIHRRASNGIAFVARVYEETGIALDVISAAEEARLAVLGCQSLLAHGGKSLVFDIGGGSTELILVDMDGRGHAHIRDWISVPWGVVSLAETEARDLPDLAARTAAFDRMRARVSEQLAEFAERIQPLTDKIPNLLGTSGTVTTLASLHLGLPTYDRRLVDGCFVPGQAMREISARLASLSPADRAREPSIGQDRADLVVAGCAILDSILAIWPAESLRVADRGIREGILRTLMNRDGHWV